jgi:glycosyltransferase involved in cell wall biosynthesis
MISMNALISVIIPVYNRQAYLRDCIDSLFAQTHHDLEIILIDDGSTDETPKICDELAKADSRILFLKGSHGGVSAARNLGLDAATGKYVFFLDSDDAIHPRLLETLASAMDQENAAMGGTWVINVPDSKWNAVPKLIARYPHADSITFHAHSETVDALFRCTSPFGLIGGVMMRRDLIGSTRFRKDIFIGEDYYFIYENMIKGADSVFLHQKWYYCRLHGSNSTHNYSFDGFYTRFIRRKLVWENEERLGRPENANVEKHSLFMAYLSCIQKHQMNKQDEKKMCAIMKDHRRDILPALNFPRKVRFYLTVYFPFSHRLYCKILSVFKK